MAEVPVSDPSPTSLCFHLPESRPYRRELVELGVGFALVMLTVWSRPPFQAVLFLVATTTILYIVLRRPRENGCASALRMAGLRRSMWVALAAILLAGVLVVAALKLGTVHGLFGRVPSWVHVTAYTVWAFEQEFILQLYFLARLLKIFSGKTAAILAAAALFSIAHLPNPFLTVVTLAWGAIACGLFLRYRNLYAIAFAHAILGLAIAISVPSHLTHHMMVGLGFYHP